AIARTSSVCSPAPNPPSASGCDCLSTYPGTAFPNRLLINHLGMQFPMTDLGSSEPWRELSIGGVLRSSCLSGAVLFRCHKGSHGAKLVRRRARWKTGQEKATIGFMA